MYLFPDVKEMDTPGKLKQFLDDLSSGKLHREFHYGPDPVAEQKQVKYIVNYTFLVLNIIILIILSGRR